MVRSLTDLPPTVVTIHVVNILVIHCFLLGLSSDYTSLCYCGAQRYNDVISPNKYVKLRLR